MQIAPAKFGGLTLRLYYPDSRRRVSIDGFRPRVAPHPSGAQRVALPAGGAEGTEGWDAARHGPAPGENFGRPFPLALRAKLAAEEVTASHSAASCCADEQSVGTSAGGTSTPIAATL